MRLIPYNEAFDGLQKIKAQLIRVCEELVSLRRFEDPGCYTGFRGFPDVVE